MWRQHGIYEQLRDTGAITAPLPRRRVTPGDIATGMAVIVIGGAGVVFGAAQAYVVLRGWGLLP